MTAGCCYRLITEIRLKNISYFDLDLENGNIKIEENRKFYKKVEENINKKININSALRLFLVLEPGSNLFIPIPINFLINFR